MNIVYSVEGVSKREYTNKQGIKVLGYTVYVSFPNRFGVSHADIWVSEKLYNEKPIAYGDNLELFIAPGGRLIDYIVIKD